MLIVLCVKRFAKLSNGRDNRRTLSPRAKARSPLQAAHLTRNNDAFKADISPVLFAGGIVTRGLIRAASLWCAKSRLFPSRVFTRAHPVCKWRGWSFGARCHVGVQ